MSGRNPTIDVLRGAAVLAVVLLHLNIRVPLSSSAWGQWLPRPLYSLLFWSGYQGVIVFFVISGFLITTTSLQRWPVLRRMEIGRFYRLRFARIAPPLLLFLLAQSLLQNARVPGFFDEKPAASLGVTVLHALTFRLNWLEAQVGYLPGAWDVLWSLCVEEVFYLCFPLVLRLLGVSWQLAVLFAVLVVLGPFARVGFGSNEIWADHSYLSCMGEIALGCTAALLVRRYQPTPRGRTTLLVGGLAMMALILYFRRATSALGLYDWGLNATVLSLGTAALLLATARDSGAPERVRSAWLAPLRWVGTHSYEIYLSHLFLVIPATLAFKRIGTPSVVPLLYAVVVLGSALLGAVMARFYSEPVGRWLRAR